MVTVGAVPRTADPWRIENPEDPRVRKLWERGTAPGRMGGTGKNTGASRLGWVDLPSAAVDHEALRDELLAEGFRRLTVVGMGGAGLSSKTVTSLLPRELPGLEPHLLATLDPAEVRRALAPDRLGETVFLIASRSGTTVETRALESVIREALADAGCSPSKNLLALTEPGSPLAGHALRKGYRRLFHGAPRVGGRFSALDAYGLLPAALAGCPVEQSLEAAHRARRELECGWPNDGFRAGGAIAALAESEPLPRLTLSADPSLKGFLPWLEQLLAESLGKEGKGILPVRASSRPDGIHFGEEAPEPSLIHSHPKPPDVLGELFRWQVAIGTAGALMGVDPYDQPDIDGGKARVRELRKASGPATIPETREADLAAFFGRAPAAGITLNAFLPRTPAAEAAFEGLRREMEEGLGFLPAMAWGPGLLHSFGQLQKGGPRKLGVLICTSGIGEELFTPEGRGLGELMHLLALADYEELRAEGRPVCWIHAPAPGDAGREAGIQRIRSAL